MKLCGIIAEYNPFHNGHEYHINLAKKNHDAVIIVMSGSFVQRGETAITDKWSRAECAIRSGADLVLELPVVYALNTAERFAFGGVSVLNSLGCVNTLSFGSECGSDKALISAAKTLINETASQSETINRLMKQGIPYAAARSEAFKNKIPAEILSNPNNILGVEYIKQLILSKSKIKPQTHLRQGSGYNSTELSESFASASAIRKNIHTPEKISEYIPNYAKEILSSSCIYSTEMLDTAAVYFLRTTKPEIIASTLEASEGIENRIIDSAKKHSTIDEISDAVCTKRYTRTRIRRIILSSMLGITAEMCKIKPDYIRVLGIGKKGREILAHVKKNTDIDIITKTADYKKKNILFEKDILANDIFSLCAAEKNLQKAGADFTTSPVILK